MPTTAGRAARQRAARPPQGRAFVIAAAVVLGLLILWTGVRLISARGHLADAQHSAETLRTSLTSADATGSSQTLSELQSSVASASSALNDPIVVVASKVPILGRNIAAPREVANVLNGVAQDTLPGLVDLAGQMAPSKIMSGGGKINLDVLRSSTDGLDQASAALADASGRLDSINTGWTLPPVGNGVHQVQDAVGKAAGAVATGARFAKIGPEMLGGNGTKRYLLISQNNAEIRTTGGLPGAWSEIDANDGKLTLGKLGSANEMNVSDERATGLSFEEEILYTDKMVTDFRDVNFTPDFPRAAGIAAAMATKRVGLDVDGVISLDPVTLSYLLRATGPVKPAIGDELTADNAVDTLLNGVYLKYEKNEQQDAYFASATAAVFDAITRPNVDAKALAEGLSKAATERRLMLWSKDPTIQKQLAGTSIAHQLPSGPSSRPQIGFYLSDVSAAKMDYYLTFNSTMNATKCSSDGRQTFTGTLTLTSNAPPDAANLPEYITGGKDRALGLRPGDLTLAVSIFAPHRGAIKSVAVRGEKPDRDIASFAPAEWKARGVGQTTVTLSPGQSKTLDIVLRSGKDSRGDADVAQTPSGKPNTESVYTVKSAC
jgi:hypothetical protein